ncbi:MAG: radical SAM protein [Candidatus Aenigmarchaeota archaeon]|nr:radical SAM protein [Candidatus Aenigmarchaeota archaeon]
MEELNKKETLSYNISYFLNFPFVIPRFINFGLTHRCNLRCNICETYEENPKVEDELTIEELKKTISEIGNWGDINISFAGGEPLIRKEDLLECIKHAKKKKLTTHVTTNGLLLTKRIAKEIVNSGLDYLQISLDGSTKETNDYIRDKGSFDGAMKAIDYILEAKNNNDSNLRLSITTVVTDVNLDELLDIYVIVKEKDLHEVAYNPYNIDTSYMKSKDYDEDEFWVQDKNIKKLRKICEELIELKKKEGKIGTPFLTLKLMPEYFKKKQRFNSGICLAGFSYMYIKPNGYVDICGKGPSLNVRDHNIKEIWYSLTFAKTRLLIRKCRRPCLMLCFPRIENWW